MRNRVVCLTAALLIGFIGLTPVHAQDAIENILVNGGFEDGVVEPWTIYGGVTTEVVEELVGAAVPEDPIEGDFCLHLEVPTAGANFWDSWIKYEGLIFEQGKYYTLSAFLKCKEGTLQIDFKPELNANPWTGYGEQSFTMTDKWAEYSVTTPVFTGDVSSADIVFLMAYAAGDFWIDGIRFYEGDYVPPVLRKRVTASSPNPGKAAVDVPRDTVLSWTPSPLADTHNVYVGTVYDDVNNADTTNTLDVLVGQNQDANSYDPAGLLDFGQTYYWRVDEVNNLNPESPWKGDVWSFTAEPFVYPIENIIATASSWQSGMGPGNTVNGSGLDDNDLHSTNDAAMWLSGIAGPQPTWIKYEFDSVYKLHEMWLWNSNMAIEPLFGLGLKDVTVEYSTNGSDWTLLSSISEFAQGPGTNGYAHNAPIDLGGVIAKYVKITANSSWGGMTQYGLSEVRFLYKPVRARGPQPASGQADVAQNVVLSWREGREAASHEVYFSTDRQAVINGSALVDTVSENSYDPGPLELRKIYYWKINEVNDVESPRSWEGDVWSFSTLEYSVVDDFEQYNDIDNIIYNVWADYFVNNTGATVGHFDPPFAERSIVHEGSQSMPFRYDNDGTVNEGSTYEQAGTMYYSEAECEWAVTQDWTRESVTSLTLWLRGIPASVGSFTAGPPITMTGAGADIYDMADHFHFAYKQLSGVGSITAKVVSVGNTDPWAKAGVMMRETLAADAKNIMIAVTPGNGVSLQRRATTSGGSEEVDRAAGPEAPQWVRLIRSGNTFTGQYSANGTTWQTVESTTMTMLTNVYVGLALTSHNTNATCTAEFSDVAITGTVTGDWQSQDIGIESNIPEPMYVVLADSAGNNAEIKHPDPAISATGSWTEWNIPLADFTGVNMQAIKSMTIVVGDRANTQAGGEGMLYIDDIRLYPPPPAE